MTRTDLVRQLRRDHPELSVAQIAQRASVSHGTAWAALRKAGIPLPARPTSSHMMARKLHTLYPDMPTEEIARRVRLPLLTVQAALDGYTPQHNKRSKRAALRPVRGSTACADCGQGALVGRDRCFVCLEPYERRQKARAMASGVGA
jgi:predicted DNA-binding transcriptional regulator YafY